MSRQIKTPDGVIHTFPDDATDAEIGNALNSGPMPTQATAPPAAATRGMTPPSTMQESPKPAAGEMSEEAWAALPTGEKARQALQWGGKVIAGMTGMGGAGREAVDNPKTTLTLAAAGPAVKQIGALAPRAAEGVRRIGGISKIRGAQNISEAVSASKDVAIDPAHVASAADELMQFKGIERVPMVVRKLVTELQAGPMNVERARQFYPALSRMSANEFASLTPNMQRLVGGLKGVFNDAITDAAATVGKGEQYAKGMSEYAKASRVAAQWDKTGKPIVMGALKRIAQGTGLAAGYEAGRRLID